jgi:hypothetical protein
MLAARIVCPVSYLLLGISSSVGSEQGLAERILATACVLWMGTLAVNLIRVSRDHDANELRRCQGSSSASCARWTSVR